MPNGADAEERTCQRAQMPNGAECHTAATANDALTAECGVLLSDGAPCLTPVLKASHTQNPSPP